MQSGNIQGEATETKEEANLWWKIKKGKLRFVLCAPPTRKTLSDAPKDTEADDMFAIEYLVPNRRVCARANLFKYSTLTLTTLLQISWMYAPIYPICKFSNAKRVNI